MEWVDQVVKNAGQTLLKCEDGGRRNRIFKEIVVLPSSSSIRCAMGIMSYLVPFGFVLQLHSLPIAVGVALNFFPIRKRAI